MNKYIELEKIIDKDLIRYNEPMKNHITMKVGGLCECLVMPTTIEQIKDVIEFARTNNIEYHCIGNGSNILVLDDGIHGMVIKIASKFNKIEVENDVMTVYSGCSMPKAALVAKQHLLTGFEFACGIPGTVGGGIKMNAGAYGGQMSDIVEEVTYLDKDGNIKTIEKSNMNFSYRHSIFIEDPTNIIISAKFKLQTGNLEDIKEKMDANCLARRTKQPLEYPNAGSVFRRPEGYFVGKLVGDSGLRGTMVGGAQVSEKHTGFIINKDNATCKDVLDLIKLVQDTVYEKFNVELKTEVEIIGGNK